MINNLETRNEELKEIIEQSSMNREIILPHDEVVGLSKRMKTYYNPKGEKHEVLKGTNNSKILINETPTMNEVNSVDTIKFEPKKLLGATKVHVSDILNSDLDVLEYIKQNSISALEEKSEEEMLNTGYGLTAEYNHLQKIFAAEGVKTIKTEFFGTDSPTEGRIGTFDREELEYGLALVESNSKSGEITIVLDRSVSSVVDGNGTSIVTHANKLPKSAGRIFDHPAYRKTLGKNNEYNFTAAIIFDKDAVAISYSDIKIRLIADDSINALAGTITIAVEAYRDIQVINPKGIVALGYDTLAVTE